MILVCWYTRAYDGLVKESGPPIQEMPAMSAMTDGSKRSLTPDAVESLKVLMAFSLSKTWKRFWHASWNWM